MGLAELRALWAEVTVLILHKAFFKAWLCSEESLCSSSMFLYSRATVGNLPHQFLSQTPRSSYLHKKIGNLKPDPSLFEVNGRTPIELGSSS